MKLIFIKSNVPVEHPLHRSGLHLLDLINDVLDMARIEAGQWELHEESVALGDLVQQAQRLAGGSAGEARHRFEAQLPPPELVVRADRRRPRQVLINLIGNAVKFTPEGGRIAVGMSVGDGGFGSWSPTPASGSARSG